MKKSLILVSAVSAVLFSACSGSNEPTQAQLDSIAAAQFADSVRIADSLEQLRLADSLEQVRIADSIYTADSLAALKAGKPVSTVNKKTAPKPAPAKETVTETKQQGGMKGKSDQAKAAEAAAGGGGMKAKSDQAKAAEAATGGGGMKAKSDQAKSNN